MFRSPTQHAYFAYPPEIKSDLDVEDLDEDVYCSIAVRKYL